MSDKLTNADILFLIQLVDAHRQGMYLRTGKNTTEEEFVRYQAQLLLKLRAFHLRELDQEGA